MAPAESRPVDVCLETIYGLNSGVFLFTLLHLPYPNRGVVWHSIQSVFTCLFTPFIACLSAPPGYVHLCVGPSLRYGLFFPLDGMRIVYQGAFSRRVHVFTAWSSLDQYLSTDSTV